MESIQKRENSAIRHLKLDNRTDRCWLHGATGNVGHVVFCTHFTVPNCGFYGAGFALSGALRFTEPRLRLDGVFHEFCRID